MHTQYFSVFCSACQPQTMHSGTTDVIVIKHQDSYKSTPFYICFGTWDTLFSKNLVNVKINKKDVNTKFTLLENGYIFPHTISSQELKNFNLNHGKNTIEYKFQQCILESEIYLYDSTEKFILSDFDGTFTKSDLIGFYNNILQNPYNHEGFQKLVQELDQYGYKVVFLTMRSLPLYEISKKYIRKHIGIDLPILMQPEQPILAIKKQLIRTSDLVKCSLIKKFKQTFPQKQKPFAGGIGNRQNDAVAYHYSDIELKDIYIVDVKSRVQRMSETNKSYNFETLAKELQRYFPKLSKPKVTRPSFIKISC